MRVLRFLAGVAVCVVLPLATRWARAWGPAWAMYTSTTEFRLTVTGTDRAGGQHALPLARVADRLSPRTAAVLLAGEQWQHGSVLSLPTQLEPFAALACAATPTAVRVDAQLEVRDPARPLQPATVYRAHHACREAPRHAARP